jgi:uncharacterized protein (UPF0210 family)
MKWRLGITRKETVAARMIPVPVNITGERVFFRGLLFASFIRLWRDLANLNEIIRRLKRNVILTIAITIVPVNNAQRSNPFISLAGSIPATIHRLTN